MKAYLASLFDHDIDLQERLFRLVALFGISALTVMFFLSVVIQESLLDLIMILLGLTGFAMVAVLSLKFHRVQIGASIIATVLIYIMLPLIYMASGGMYGGTSMWFIFAAIFISLTIRGAARVFYLISCGVVLVGCFLVQWFFPEQVTPHTAIMAYTDALASTIIVGFFVSLMVIFESKIYVEEQRLAEERRKQIEEINRAQNRFFSNMSHEIRTPINTIIGLNEMILREAVTTEVAEDARSIQGASQMLLTLINDVLDMSKIDSGKMELVETTYSIGEMLSEIVNMIWSRAQEKGLEFRVEIDEKTPKSLIGDDVRIKQILINLLNNAVKYTKEGSVTLTIECRNLPELGRVDMIATVSDTGEGIRKEALPTLFDVFRRVEEGRNRYIEGTGLGLSIVKQLVDLMHGEITVDSVYTKGSTFRVRIPQGVADNEELGELKLRTGQRMRDRQEYRQSFEAPGACVLIVDDNELNLAVAEKLLSATRMGIDTVLSGAECLELTQNHHYDLILMDHLMPEMDGVETLKAIRSQRGGMNRETPVIVLTANAGSENQAFYKRCGFDGYLLKPVTGEQLEDTVRPLLPEQLVSLTGIATMRADDTEILDRHTRKTSLLITTDSICDLPPQVLAAHHIEAIPYRIRTEEGTFMDGLDIDTGEVIEYIMRKQGKPISAMAPSVEDYEVFFADRLLHAEQIVHITTSGGGEYGYRNATEASHAFGNVTVFDTRQISGGIGLLVILAARIVETENLSPRALTETLMHMRENVRTTLVVNNTGRLAAAGRISQRLHNIMTSFMLKPMLSPIPGGFRIRGFTGGPRQQFLRSIVNRVFRSNIIDRSRLIVLSPNMSPDETASVQTMIEKQRHFEDVRFFRTSGATSLLWGPDAVAFVFLINQ